MHTIKAMEHLMQLLNDLQEGKIEAIEYGDPINPSGYLTGIRIKYINTPGGQQFRICQVSRNMECGGIYEYEAEDIFTHASRMQERHDRPIENPKIREFMKNKPKTPIEWFGIEKLMTPVIKTQLPPIVDGAVEINL